MRQFVAWAAPGVAPMHPLVKRHALFVFTWATLAQGHHDVGHGPSEGLRNLVTMGSDPSPHQRASLLTQVSRTTSEPTLNSATVYSLLLLADIRLHQRLYVGAQLPGVLIHDDLGETKPGFGNMTLGVTVPVGSFEREGAASWALGFQMTFPTRTFTYEVDPGKQWTYSPQLRYADASGRVLWYASLLTPLEHRPAGWALDISPALGIGYGLTSGLYLTLGTQFDVRVLSVCATVDGGSESCPSGRATEMDRPLGATRGYASLGLSSDFHRHWSLFSSAQVPLLSRRDIEWAVSLGVEARF